MTEDYKSKLSELKKKQKEHESEVMRAQFAQEEAKKKVLEASKALKEVGFSNIKEAEAEIRRLEAEIQANIEEAQKVLGV